MSSIMRWRNGLMACLVIGDAPVLSEVVEPLDLKTGRPVTLSLACVASRAAYRASGLVLGRKADALQW